MLDLKNNLRKRICDCEPNATNTQTYLEYIIESCELLFSDKLSEEDIKNIERKTNEELNELLDWLDYLADK